MKSTGFDTVGEMRHRIKFITPITGRDAMGGEIKTWLESNEVWAHVEQTKQGSDEQLLAERITGVTAAIVKVRYDATLKPKMRLVFNTVEWMIHSVIPDVRNMYCYLEVEQYKPYQSNNWVTPDGEDWIDPDGNTWVWLDEAGNPLSTDTSAIATGNLTWTDPVGTTWVLTQT